MNLPRLLRTVRHLRRSQITGQLTLRVRRYFENPARQLAVKPPTRPAVNWSLRTPFIAPHERDEPHITHGTFTFINQTHEIGFPPQWKPPGLPLLWQYNLHYHEFLWSLEYDSAKAVVQDWIAHHPPQRGAVGWSPYPTSLRLMNWLALFYGQWREQIQADTSFQDELWASVWRQTRWLAKHLETHLGGNHLFENAVALAFVGACWDGPQANAWSQAGWQLLAGELDEQVLPDGMHFERSPMYQCRMLYALSMLANVANPTDLAWVSEKIKAMSQALGYLTHPDGDIALFNDAARDIYLAPASVCAFANRVTEQSPTGATPDTLPKDAWSMTLPDAGFYVGYAHNNGYVVCDAGALGPDYLLGHAHADMLSFELTLGGQRLVVDGGTYDYVESSMRRYCRSVKAHNTVQVDAGDQAEFWGAFRVGRRGRAKVLDYQTLPDGFRMRAQHNGFAHQPGQPIHCRDFRWHHNGTLMLRDTVTGRRGSTATSRLHLAPGTVVQKLDEGRLSVTLGSLRCMIYASGPGVLELGQADHCPDFGRRQGGPLLSWTWPIEEGAQAIAITVEASDACLDVQHGLTRDQGVLAF